MFRIKILPNAVFLFVREKIIELFLVFLLRKEKGCQFSYVVYVITEGMSDIYGSGIDQRLYIQK